MRRATKRIAATALCMAMLIAVLAGCGNKIGETTPNADPQQTISNNTASNEAAAPRTEIHVGISTTIDDWAPFARSGSGTIVSLGQVYQHLIEVTADGIQPVLAKSWEQPDELTLNIYLYENIHDSEGNHITARDVVFSYNTYIEAGNRGAVAKMDSITAIDEYTVQMKLSKPLGLGDLEKYMARAYIVSEKAYTESVDGMSNSPIGTGPYKLSAFVPASSYTLTAVDNYWQTEDAVPVPSGMANVETIVLNVILDAAQMSIALENGSIQMSATVNTTDLVNFVDNPNYNVSTVLDGALVAMYMNAGTNSPCQDINLRKAILYGVDMDGLVAGLPVAAEALNAWSIPNKQDYQSEWDERDYFEYDLDAAKEYLDQSSYDGEPLTILCSNMKGHDGAALMIQGYLAEVGVNCTISQLDDTNYDVARHDPEAWDILISMNGGGNYSASLWNTAWNIIDNRDRNNGMNVNFIDDETLNELLQKAYNAHCDENVVAFQAHIDEMAYGRGMFVTFNSVVTTSDIVPYLAPDGMITIGAGTYAPVN